MGQGIPKTQADKFVDVAAGIDASRRVGWAKFYDVTERLDDALRDLNIARDDREIFEHGFSFMVGVMNTVLTQLSDREREVLAPLVERIAQAADPDHVQRGERRASQAMDGRGGKISWFTPVAAREKDEGRRAGRKEIIAKVCEASGLPWPEVLAHLRATRPSDPA